MSNLLVAILIALIPTAAVGFVAGCYKERLLAWLYRPTYRPLIAATFPKRQYVALILITNKTNRTQKFEVWRSYVVKGLETHCLMSQYISANSTLEWRYSPFAGVLIGCGDVLVLEAGPGVECRAIDNLSIPIRIFKHSAEPAPSKETEEYDDTDWWEYEDDY